MALHLRPIMKNLKKHVFEKSCYFGGKIAKKWRKNRHFWWAKYPTGPVGYWVGFRAGSGITNTRNTRSGTRLSGTRPITSPGTKTGMVIFFPGRDGTSHSREKTGREILAILPQNLLFFYLNWLFFWQIGYFSGKLAISPQNQLFFLYKNSIKMTSKIVNLAAVLFWE